MTIAGFCALLVVVSCVLAAIISMKSMQSNTPINKDSIVLAFVPAMVAAIIGVESYLEYIVSTGQLDRWVPIRRHKRSQMIAQSLLPGDEL